MASHSSSQTGGEIPTESKTIVHINKDGRIVISRDVRRVLDIEQDRAQIEVRYNGTTAQGIISIDELGRATLPVQMRRYLGLEGKEADLQVVVSQISSSSVS